MSYEYSLPGEKGIVAEGGEVHIRTPNGDTSFRIAGDKAKLRTRKLKSLSDKREYLAKKIRGRVGSQQRHMMTIPWSSVCHVQGDHFAL